MIEELADDYAAYLKVDLGKELAPVEETIDDMLTRLEEFESLVAMVNSSASQSFIGPISEILSRKKELDALCEKIDRLEVLVQRVKKDVAVVEAQVETAEADLAPADSSFKSIFKPFFKKSDTSTSRSSRAYQPPEIFKAADYFESAEEKQEGATAE